VHVDDEVGVALTESACRDVLAIIEDSIAATGGSVNDKKTLQPARRQIVHGVQVDTVDCTLSITADKRYNYIVLMLLALELDRAIIKLWGGEFLTLSTPAFVADKKTATSSSPPIRSNLSGSASSRPTPPSWAWRHS
jgi:hypothetical protein